MTILITTINMVLGTNNTSIYTCYDKYIQTYIHRSLYHHNKYHQNHHDLSSIIIINIIKIKFHQSSSSIISSTTIINYHHQPTTVLVLVWPLPAPTQGTPKRASFTKAQWNIEHLVKKLKKG